VEVIVVNDGSTDNSHNVISQFANNITYINQINSGAATARNNGFEMATGVYCVCLDADDWISPNYITDAVKLISDDSTIVSPIVYTADANLNITSSAVWPTDELIKTNKNTVRSLLLCNRATNCSVFPRNKWKQVGGYDPQNPKAEDYGLWIDLVAVGCKILYLDKNKMYMLYRQHGPSQITSVSDEQQFDYTYTKHGIFETGFSRKQKIQALYKFYLDRDADLNGLQHYFESDFSILQIRDILFNSEEYKKRWH
jgi:glycosyltransferase involved in cell wall biosynthesis